MSLLDILIQNPELRDILQGNLNRSQVNIPQNGDNQSMFPPNSPESISGWGMPQDVPTAPPKQNIPSLMGGQIGPVGAINYSPQAKINAAMQGGAQGLFAGMASLKPTRYPQSGLVNIGEALGAGEQGYQQSLGEMLKAAQAQPNLDLTRAHTNYYNALAGKALGPSNKQYTQHVISKDPKSSTGYRYYIWDESTGDFTKPSKEAPPSYASQMQPETGSLEGMAKDLADGKINYDQVQRNLGRNVKAQTQFLNILRKTYPDVNPWQSSASARYYGTSNIQDRLRFMDSLIGDPQTGAGGQLNYVKELSNAVDRTKYPIINKAILKANKDYFGDEPTAQFIAGLYNVALESARATAGSGSVIPQERVDQELDRMSAAFNKGQLNSVLDVVRNELLMRRETQTKGTPGAFKAQQPTTSPQGGTQGGGGYKWVNGKLVPY